jgi:tRNA-2-methylthio-N6-dimethylallyladenosine synthase
MKRGYTVTEYKSIVRRLRARRSCISISSDFIVGFPGETAADFEATMRLIEDVGFDASFSFVYSRRPGTPAAALPDATPQAVKLARLQRLQAMIAEQAQAISRGMLGTQQLVLVGGHAKKNAAELSGRTENNRVVNFPGPSRLIGQFADVTITAALPHSLRGEIVAVEA